MASRSYLLAVGGEVLAVAALFGLALVAFVHWFPPYARWPPPFDGLKPKPLRYALFYVVLAILGLTDYAFWSGGTPDLDHLDSGVAILLLMVAVAFVASGAATMFAVGARRLRDSDSSRAEALRLLGVFFVVTLLSASVAAGGSLGHPKVRPVAVLMLDEPVRVICGIYVGQTSDRVYCTSERRPRRRGIVISATTRWGRSSN